LPRERQILEILYTGHKKYTTAQIASLLQMSSRTIKNDIKKIKDELENSGCIIHTKTGEGIWLEYTIEGQEYLEKILISNENNAAILPEMRKYYIALELLRNDHYISMESISNKLFTSKSTIVNDVNKLIDFFYKYQLELEKSVKYGIIIKGNELKKRIAEAAVLRKIVAYQDNQVLNRLQPFFDNVHLEEIGKMIVDTEEKFNLIISDNSYINFILQISLMIEHILQDKKCDYFDVDIKDDSLEWKVTQYLVEKIQNEIKIDISKNDCNYIYMNVVGLKYQNKSIYQNKNIDNIRKISSETFDGIIEILKEVDTVYGEDLSKDNEFIVSLFIHLNALFTRLVNSIYLENPLKKSIKNDLAYEYEISTYISQLLSREHYYFLKEDDICDLALYVGASIKRRKANSLKRNPSVVIVCGSGMSTSQFLEAKIKLAFPDIIIKDTIPLLKAYNLKKEDQDFVISTVPLQLDDIDVVHVSPILEENDIAKLDKRLKLNFEENYNHGIYNQLLSCIKESICFFKCDCRSQEEVIYLMSTRLMNQKYVDEGFIESVKKRENLASTSIGDGFAIPHSFKGHVLKPGIGFMTLKKPIQWGEEKVQIILMIAMDPSNKEPFKLIFGQLATLTKDVERIQRILEASNYKEFKNALK
ncbi:MAG: BglG family transcription antiterminator, partial [Traorella sp.]